MVFQKGGFGGCSPGTKTGTRVHSDVPPERKPEERGYVRMFPQNENRNEGTFALPALLQKLVGEFFLDASFLLTVEVFLLTVRLF